MSLLVISGITIRLGGRTLLDNADLTVDPGRRIGLVGRNGAGKSTLLRAIAGELALDGGDIRLAARARHRHRRSRRRRTGRRIACSTPCWRATPSAWPCWPRPRPPSPHRLAEIHDRLLAIGADAAPARAADDPGGPRLR